MKEAGVPLQGIKILSRKVLIMAKYPHHEYSPNNEVSRTPILTVEHSFSGEMILV